MNTSVNPKSDNLYRLFLFLPFLAILSVCGLAYVNAFTHDFLLDDYTHLIGPVTLNDISLPRLYTEGHQGFYRPFAFMFLKGMLAVFGKNAVAYHVYNFALFYVLCALFYQILLRLRFPTILALVTVLLYAVHPINNFLVNYKTAGNNTIFMICMQAAFLFWLNFVEKKSRRYFILSLGVFFLSLISHEITFMLPAYIFLAGYYALRMPAKKLLIQTLFFAVPFAIYLVIRSQVLTSQPLNQFLSTGIPVLAYGKALIKLVSWYFSQLVFPKDVIFLWDERIVTAHLKWYEMTVGVAVMVTTAALIVRRSRNIFSFAYLLFFAGLLPLGLAGATYTSRFGTAILEPHWFGFSSIGFFVLAAGSILQLQRFVGNRGVLFVVLLAVFFLGAITRRENAMWRNERVYCEYWLKTNALNGTPWNCWADANIHEKDKGTASSAYTGCEDPALLGFSNHVKADLQMGINYYRLALEKDPQCAPAIYGLALLFDDLRNQTTSQQFLIQAQQLRREYLPLYFEIKKVFDNIHDKESATRISEMLRQLHREER